MSILSITRARRRETRVISAPPRCARDYSFFAPARPGGRNFPGTGRMGDGDIPCHFSPMPADTLTGSFQLHYPIVITTVITRHVSVARITPTRVDDEYYLRRAFAEFETGEKCFTLDECNERMKAAVYGIQDGTVIVFDIQDCRQDTDKNPV